METNRHNIHNLFIMIYYYGQNYDNYGNSFQKTSRNRFYYSYSWIKFVLIIQIRFKEKITILFLKRNNWLKENWCS